MKSINYVIIFENPSELEIVQIIISLYFEWHCGVVLLSGPIKIDCTSKYWKDFESTHTKRLFHLATLSFGFDVLQNIRANNLMAPLRPTKSGVSKHEKLNHCQSVETSRNNQIWQNIVSRYRKKCYHFYQMDFFFCFINPYYF